MCPGGAKIKPPFEMGVSDLEKPSRGDQAEITDKPLQKEEENNKSDKDAWKEDKKDKEKENSREDGKKKEFSNLTEKEMTKETNENSAKESEDELRKAMTEAELLRMAETLKNLTEEELRELYRKGFLNLSEQELERLIDMIRTQMIIDEEKVSLSDELPTLEEDKMANNHIAKYWSVLWAFLLGAIVMFLIREFMQKCKKKETENQKTDRVATGTRKLK